MGYGSYYRSWSTAVKGCDRPVFFDAVELETEFKNVFGDKKVILPHQLAKAMNGWKLQGYWYKSTRTLLNVLASKSIRWCDCLICLAEETKKDQRAIELHFSGRQSFGGDFSIVFRANRPGRVYLRSNDGALQRILAHEPIEKIKSWTTRSKDDQKDGKGKWIGTREDGSLMFQQDSNWPTHNIFDCPVHEKYDTPDGLEPPHFGPSIPSLKEIAETIRISLADGELDSREVASFVTTLTSFSSSSSSSFSSSSLSSSSSISSSLSSSSSSTSAST